MNFSNSSTGSLKESIGGIGYFLLFFSEYFPYTFLATFATVFGFIGFFFFSRIFYENFLKAI